MIDSCISEFSFANSSIVKSSTLSIPKSNMVFYDVIRVIQGIPIFVEAHAERFFSSFSLAAIEVPFERSFFIDAITQFIQANNLFEGNIRCVYFVNNTPDFYIYQISHSYPSIRDYELGVNLDVLHAERENPNIKQELSVRNLAIKKIADLGVYDVVLIDSQNNVTEGSKTNIFFVSDSKLHTALASDVLCGITRSHIIQCARNIGVEVCECKISYSDINKFAGAFVSGTSPKVLPIARISSVSFNVSHDLIQKISDSYNHMIELYIMNKKTQ